MVMSQFPVRAQLSTESAALLDIVVQLHAAAAKIILRHADTSHFDRIRLAEISTLCTPFLAHFARAMVLVDLLTPPKEKEAPSCPPTPSATATAAAATPAAPPSPAATPAASGATHVTTTSAPPATDTARHVRPLSSQPPSHLSAAQQHTTSGIGSVQRKTTTSDRPINPQPKPAGCAPRDNRGRSAER